MTIFAKLILSAWFIFCWLVIGCSPKLMVDHVASSSTIINNNDGGIYYALPMTMLTVEIPVTRITHEPAPAAERDEATIKERVGAALLPVYCKMADDATRVFYKIDDENIKISARAVPDVKKVYHVSLAGRWNQKQDLTIALNELGQFTQGEVVREDHTFDIITQGVQAAAGIASTFLFPKSGTTSEVETFKSKPPKEINLTYLEDVRTARKTLITSENNIGAEGILNRKLAELDKLEDVLISKLSFTETKKNVILRADILIPQKVEELKPDLALLSFSKEKGITLHLTPTDGSYQNENLRYYCTFATTPDPAQAEKIYYLHYAFATGQQVTDVVASANAADTKNGLAYNVPAWVRTSVYSIPAKGKDDKSAADSGRATLSVATVPAPQLGKVAYMPEKTSKTGLELDPLTGALRKVSVSQNGITGDQIKSAGAALTSTATLFQKTPLTDVQTEVSILEQRVKKLKLETQLDSLERSKSRTVITAKE